MREIEQVSMGSGGHRPAAEVDNAEERWKTTLGWIGMACFLVVFWAGLVAWLVSL